MEIQTVRRVFITVHYRQLMVEEKRRIDCLRKILQSEAFVNKLNEGVAGSHLNKDNLTIRFIKNGEHDLNEDKRTPDFDTTIEAGRAEGRYAEKLAEELLATVVEKYPYEFTGWILTVKFNEQFGSAETKADQ